MLAIGEMILHEGLRMLDGRFLHNRTLQRFLKTKLSRRAQG